MRVMRRGSRVELVLDGEFDISSRHECPVPRRLVDDEIHEVVVNMSDVSFLDLEGLRYVMEVRAVARERACAFRLVPGPRHVQRVFELTGWGADLSFAEAA